MRKLYFSIVILLFSANISHANNSINNKDAAFEIGIAFLPNVSETLDDTIPKYISRISEIANQSFDLEILPFKRSMNMAESGQIDAHIPVIYNPLLSTKDKPYFFSEATLWKTNFVLYTHKDTEVNLDQLDKLSLISGVGLIPYIDLHVTPVSNIEGAIQMVDFGRVDGLIYSSPTIDPLIKKLKLTNIRRTLYKVVDAKALIKKGKKGELLDRILSSSIKTMRESGELDKRIKKLSYYDDWQPYKD